MIKNEKYELYNGDCLGLLQDIPDNSIDLVIIDPPYEINTMKGGGTIGKRKYKEGVNGEIKKLSIVADKYLSKRSCKDEC